MQIPCVGNRTNDIVTAVHDYPWNTFQFMRITQQLSFDFKEAAVDEIMIFDAGKTQGKMRIVMAIDEVFVLQHKTGGGFPD